MANFIVDREEEAKTIEKEEKIFEELKNRKNSLYLSCRSFYFIHEENERGVLELGVEEDIDQDKWQQIQESVEWNQLGEDILNQTWKVESLKERIQNLREQRMVDFLALLSNRECAKKFLQCLSDRAKRDLIDDEKYPPILHRFEKKLILYRIQWWYKGWLIEEEPAEVNGKASSCYSTYMLTFFNNTFEGHETISKIYLDVSYSPEDDLHGGFYCEGQDYVHLSKKELLELKKIIVCVKE